MTKFVGRASFPHTSKRSVCWSPGVVSLADGSLAGNKLNQYAGRLSWGVCHGDVSLDNVLLTSEGLALHDFDLSAEGWRARRTSSV